MSIEHYSPDESSHYGRERVQLSADMLHDKVEDVLKRLAYERDYECQNHEDYIELRGEYTQLERLRELVYLMATYENTDEYIRLDDEDEQLMPPVDPATRQPQYDADFEKEFRRGVTKGTNTFLYILANGDIPPEGGIVTDDSFSPQDIRLSGKVPVNRVYYVDKSRLTTYETCISNVEIDYYYPPGASSPHRTIYFRGEDYRDESETSGTEDEAAIDSIRNEIYGLLMDIEEARIKEGGVKELSNYCIQEARLRQLEEFSKRILGLAEGKTATTSIDVVDPELATKIEEDLKRRLPDHFPDHEAGSKTKIKSWIDTGLREGVSDGLELILPDTFMNEGVRSIQYLQWRKDLLEMAGFPTWVRKDGSTEVCHQTKVESLVLINSYSSGKLSIPRQMIRLKDPSSALGQPTQSSSPQ